ncbi:MAG: hypothetical protein WBV92_07350 [Nitrosotalea sp.]
MRYKINKLKLLRFSILVILIGISYSIISIVDVYASCTTNVDCRTQYVSSNNSPSIIISPDILSPGSKVNILIHAPDFNSNPYAIDTIGEDGSKVIVSTRESSIQYRLVETGFNTGDFVGYVILSSTTSTCSPICGPTDGYIAASGDDAITVSLVYPDGTTMSSTSFSSTGMNHKMIPEFPFVPIVLIISMISLIFFSKLKISSLK